MNEILRDAIHHQRVELARMLQEPLGKLAAQCAEVWDSREKLDSVLSDGFRSVPYCLFLYTMNPDGIQTSDNVSVGGLLPEHFGRDRSERPYMREVVPPWGFLLSDAYLSRRAHRPSVTAVQVVRRDDEILGFIGADFDLRDLPATTEIIEEPIDWRQIKGDPSIRGTVFQQHRVESVMDRNMDTNCAVLEDLITERGLFQAVIHFSSSRATVWFIDDPFRYRIFDHEALSDPDICLLYPRRQYPGEAVIPQNRIIDILSGMRKLRTADDTLYLRSASINIFNGLVSLTFSCDGSHYMSWQEFLDKDMSFWVGCAA
jgi:hypothetical protein